MIHTELRIIDRQQPTIINGNLMQYAEGWTGGGGLVQSNNLYPNLNGDGGYSAISLPSGWTWQDGYLVGQLGSSDCMSQPVYGLETGYTYTVQFETQGLVEGSGEYFIPYLYGNSGQPVYTNGLQTQQIYIANTGATVVKTYVENFTNVISGFTIAQLATGTDYYNITFVGTSGWTWTCEDVRLLPSGQSFNIVFPSLLNISTTGVTGVAGYFSGGQKPEGGDLLDTSHCKFVFSTETKSMFTAQIISAGYYGQVGVSSTSKGYICGGLSGYFVAGIDAILFSNDTISAVNNGWCNHQELSSARSTEKGYWAGGISATGQTETKNMNGISFTTEVSFLLSAKLTHYSTGGMSAINSSSKAYWLGGSIWYAAYTDLIEGLVFSTETKENPTSVLSDKRAFGVSLSAPNCGYIFGGGDKLTDKFTFYTETISSFTKEDIIDSVSVVNGTNSGYIVGSPTCARIKHFSYTTETFSDTGVDITYATPRTYCANNS